MTPKFEQLNRRIVACRRCPRLASYIRQVGQNPRAAYRDWDYWARPVTNFGSPPARLLVVGLAPGAHGANRTGRMFTGDRSGDWLFRSMWKAGFANQPLASHIDDGLHLVDCVITAACHCAPPDNRPTTQEIANCRQWLHETYQQCEPRVVVALGQIAWQAALKTIEAHVAVPRPRPKFGHLASVDLDGPLRLLGSYHPSQQNTFTGRLTEAMLDRVFQQARQIIDTAAPRP